jgi:DNA-binding transcriptional regulator YiaG
VAHILKNDHDDVQHSAVNVAGSIPSSAADEIQIAGKRYMTVERFCKLLNISTRTFGRWDASRTAPPRIRVGKKVNLIDVEKAAAWLSSQEIDPVSSRTRP